MTGWSAAPLEDLLDALIDYRGKSPPKSHSGIPVISAKVVKTTGLLRPIEQMIAPEFYRIWMRRGLPRPGDVILTTEGPLGEVIQLDNETATFALGQRVVCLRGKRGLLDNTFLRYLLSSPVQQQVLASYATGTTVAGISQQALRKVPIPYPEYDEQVRIGVILAALDDKIELNRRMNETLEEMAQAIFEDWMTKRRLPRRSVSGICAQGVLLVGDGYRAKNSEMLSGGLPFIRARELNNGFDTDNAEILGEAGVRSAGDKLSKDGDVAFTSKGTIGRFARVSAETPRFVYSPQICFWRSLDHKRLRPEALYMWMISSEFRSQLDAVSGQTDMAPYASLRDQRAMSMPAFDSEQHGVCDVILPLLRCQDLNWRQSRTLAELRDYLLPRLMSGEIRVREAEQATALAKAS